MDVHALQERLHRQLEELPVFDAHTHLVGGRMGAGGLHDIVLYHMAVSGLYAAGCPSGERLTQYPGWPTKEEADARLREAIPYLPLVKNTAMAWGIRLILADLYDWTDEITLDNYAELDARIRARAADAAWPREVMRRAGIQGACTEIARREQGRDDGFLHYALEWAFFTRCQWGEFDTALYELERCWGKTPESPLPVSGGKRPPAEKTIRRVDDVLEAVAWYVDQIPAGRVKSIATHLSTDIDYSEVSHDDMSAALKRRGEAGIAERDMYASYVNEAFLNTFELELGDRVVFQFSLGAEPLPHETASRLSDRTVAQLAEMVARHPGIRFQCFLSSAHANQALCTLCRELPNLSLAGYWWHNFFPAHIRSVMEERLDMLPLNRQIGFFSDAYCADWAYGKAAIVKRMMARVLAEKVAAGQYSEGMAAGVAGYLLFDSPRELLGL